MAVEYVNELIKENKTENAKNILKEILERNASYGPAKKLFEKIVTGQ